ncbi:MAG: hypothetical protein Q8P41_27795 [Pseudomonadota bacterium]|nr:hypothetical protein [Pseudomonadota bacterium]
MFPVWLAGVLHAAAAEIPSVPDGRALYRVVDPALEGNGPGGGLFVDGQGLGAVAASLDTTAVLAWTARPLRLSLVLPAEVGADRVLGEPPRIDALFVLSDRQRGGLGVAAGFDAPLPFLPGSDRASHGHLALGVGKKDTVVAVNLGARIGPPLRVYTWSIGGAMPVVGPLGAFAELDGWAPIQLGGPHVVEFGLPKLGHVRLGLHLAPIRPLVLTAALGATFGSAFPTLSLGAGWIPTPRPRSPRTDGPDRDRDRVADNVDACPGEREDFNGGNDADGCPDAGADDPPFPEASR